MYIFNSLSRRLEGFEIDSKLQNLWRDSSNNNNNNNGNQSKL